MSDPMTVYNWHRLDARLTSSGQPSEAELAARPLAQVDLSANGAGHGRELFGLFRRQAGLAENGASALFGND